MNRNMIWTIFLMFLLVSCGTSQSDQTASTPTLAQPTVTPTLVQPTATPTLTKPTATPTLVQPTATLTLQPTATFQPPMTPISGWQKFEAEGIELWLPDSYIGGNLDEDLDLIIESFGDLGSAYEQWAQLIEQNRSIYVLWLFDTEIGTSGYITNMTVVSNEILSVITLDMILDSVEMTLPQEFQVLEKEIMHLGAYEAGRLIIEAQILGYEIKEVVYAIIDGNNLWMLTYGTGLDEFEERLPTFEQSASTIVIKPSSPPQDIIQPVATPETKTSPIDGMTLVYVPAGDFLMGSGEDDPLADDDEKPQHTVYLDAFWIDQTEVTNAMFAAFLNEQGNQSEGGVVWLDESVDDVLITRRGDLWLPEEGYGDHPVIEVSWYGARAYCGWAGRRLPTEAEWEKAARGTDGRIYPWGNMDVAGNLLNFADRNLDSETFKTYDGITIVDWADTSVDDGYRLTAPVGSYPDGASPYGVLDMAGNAWEWAADWYDEKYYDSTPDENPTGPTSGDYPVLRGGSWFHDRQSVRTTYRNMDFPDSQWGNLGFRCALTP